MKAVIVTALLLIAATAGVSVLFLPPTNPASTTSTSVAVFNSTYTARTYFLQNPGSLTPEGCSTLINTVSSQGFQVKTYVSSTSAKIGAVLCVDVVLLDVSGPNLTQQSTDYSVVWNLTDSSGHVLTYSYCYPNPPPPQSSGAESSPSPPLPFVSCAGVWNTSSLVNGMTPQAGTYQVTVAAVVPSSAAPVAGFPAPGAPGYHTIYSNSSLTVTN
jgi:hypothetical protein